MSAHGLQHVDQPADLHAARRLVTDIATACGLGDRRAGMLAIAVSEAATNAILHGGGSATVMVHADSDTLTVDIHDRGDGLVDPASTGRPSATDIGGRGIWLARQLCDRVEINSSPAGTIVRLVMDL